MNRLQEHLLMLLCEIRDICVANDIAYYLDGGTLLGAVRSRGFLPWDDDADIVMTYDNWLRFKKACKTQMPENRYLGSITEDDSYHHVIPRYMSTDTTQIHREQVLDDVASGVVVDIFILDPIANGGAAEKSYLRDLLLLTGASAPYLFGPLSPDIDFKSYCAVVQEVEGKGWSRVARKIEGDMESCFDSEGDCYIYRWQSVPWKFRRSWFGAGQEVEFEGETFMAPAEINKVLITYYGEGWFYIPKVINAHRHDSALSLDFPYTEALDFFSPTFDEVQLRRDLVARRASIYRNAKANWKLAEGQAWTKTRIVMEHLDSITREYKTDIDVALSSKDGRALSRLLAEYLTWQTGPEMIGRRNRAGYYRFTHPLVVPVADWVFEAALLALVATNRFSAARSMIKGRMMQGMGLTPFMEELRDDIALLHEAMSDFEHGRYDEGLEIARKLAQRHPDSSLIMQVACDNAMARWRSSERPDDLDAYESLADAGLARFPNGGSFLKAKADCQAARGSDAEAEKLYLSAAEMTRNGFVLHDIAELTGYYPKRIRRQEWASDVGVPVWNGQDPSPLPSRVNGSTHEVRRLETCWDVLATLLEEVTSLCETNKVNYVLAPRIADEVCNRKRLPRNVGDYAIVCHPKDAVKLLALLQERAAASSDRVVEYIGSNPFVADRVIRYGKADSLYLPFDGKVLGRYNNLSVKVIPLECGKYRGRLGELLPKWERFVSSAKCSDSAGSHLRSVILSSIGSASSFGALLFERAMAQSAKSKKLYIPFAPSEPFDVSFLKKRKTIAISAGKFSVPSKVKTYLERHCDEAVSGKQYWIASSAYSTTLSYSHLKSLRIIDESLFHRIEASLVFAREEQETFQRFRAYFEEMKFAVEERERSLRTVRDGAPIWMRSGSIAHAGGGISATSYTNSVEALRRTLAGTHEVIELDFMFTTDNVLVCEHGWKRNGRIPQDSSTFLESKIEGAFTPMSAEQAVCMLCQSGKDVYLDVDTQEKDVAKVHACLVSLFESHGARGREFLDRIIPEIYHEEELDAVRTVYPYKHWAMATYKIQLDSPDDYARIAAFCRKRGIEVLAIAKKKLTREIVERINEEGVFVSTYALNTFEEVREYRSMGVGAYYTDFL